MSAHKETDPAEIVAQWDTGSITAEFTDDETITALARFFKTDAETIRAVLIAAGRIEAD